MKVWISVWIFLAVTFVVLLVSEPFHSQLKRTLLNEDLYTLLPHKWTFLSYLDVVFFFLGVRHVFQAGTALKPAQYQPLVKQVCVFAPLVEQVQVSSLFRKFIHIEYDLPLLAGSYC